MGAFGLLLVLPHLIFGPRPCPLGCSMNLSLPPLALPPRVTDRAFARLAEIADLTGEVKALRVAVDGGGCSGFQYDIRLDDAAADDLVLEKDGQRVLVDSVSLPFLENAVIDYTEELIGARFVIENPNATSSCGCGTSFSI
jgi:iron-sulfur cluster insertion protein